MKNCEVIITDSGGIQKEATAPSIQKPVLVIRLSTDRPEAVRAGFARVVGVEKQNLLSIMKTTLDARKVFSKTSPYGDGTAAKKIIDVLVTEEVAD